MPILTPSYLPPPPGLASPSPSCASSNATSRRSQAPSPPTSLEHDAVAQRSHVPLKRERALKIPSVELDVPAIQEDMAASLAVALLGHVLFLKSQVPFPVAQLGRVPCASSASKSRATKKRSDMVTAFDELSSHLHTTFSALSTALARNPVVHRSTDTVYLALVLGPTIGAPKARVVLALEGLEVKVWGLREDIDGARPPSSDSASEDEGEGDDNGGCSNDDGSEVGDTGAADDDVDDDGGDAGGSQPASEPPSSRSPSPSSEELSQPPSPVPAGSIRRPLRPSLSPKSSPSSNCTSQPHLAPKPARTYAEEQQTLRAAERLLSRTLANAYAEGGGMAAELAPTQIHVLLRAPRRFSHPAWLPRQNVSATLDNVLQDFLVDSGLGDAASTGVGGDGKTQTQRRRRVAGIKTEGVLVTCQNGPDKNDDRPSHPASIVVPTTVMEAREEDELIWWAWDGKLIGFAEW